jgi:Ubp3 associated protein Bre5.
LKFKVSPALTLTIKNVSNADQTFSVTSEFTLGNPDGLTVNLTPSTIKIAKGQSASVNVTFTADKTKLSKGPHEGLIWFDNGQTKLHVPFIIWNGDVAVLL